MPWTGISFLALLFSFTVTSSNSVFAIPFKHAIDSRVNIQELAAHGEPAVFSKKHGRTFQADASAVITGDFFSLAQASADYDRYRAMGMPYLLASHTVGQPRPDILYVWNWMKLSLTGFTEETKHCLRVRFHRKLGENAAGSEWTLHRCPPSSKGYLPPELRPDYEEEPAFSQMEGSWYMRPIRIKIGNKIQERIYVRYYLSARPSNPFASLMGNKIMAQFTKGARQVIQILAREASSQP